MCIRDRHTPAIQRLSRGRTRRLRTSVGISVTPSTVESTVHRDGCVGICTVRETWLTSDVYPMAGPRVDGEARTTVCLWNEGHRPVRSGGDAWPPSRSRAYPR